MKRRSKSTLHKSRQRGYLRAVTRDEGVGVCLPCGESFPTAELWKAHNAVHVGRGEHLCALCGRTFLRSTFSTHPCVASVLSAAKAETGVPMHPSCVEEGSERNGDLHTEPRRLRADATRHLRAVPSSTDSEPAS